jgi:hypothetical protein
MEEGSCTGEARLGCLRFVLSVCVVAVYVGLLYVRYVVEEEREEREKKKKKEEKKEKKI